MRTRKPKPSRDARARSPVPGRGLAEAPDEQAMPLGAIESDPVNRGLAFCRINDLPNPQGRMSGGYPQQLRHVAFGCGGIDFFIRVSEFDTVVVFQGGE